MNAAFFKRFEFFVGVPDSQLKPLCSFLMHEFGISNRHMIAANEGNCAAIAAGYHLATGKVPVVYLQNSGVGNIVNPVCSLLNDQVYAIPCLFVVGWRGEPGLHDEPQHVFQGQTTLALLKDLDIAAFVIDQETSEDAVEAALHSFEPLFEQGKSAAFVVRRGALQYEGKVAYHNPYAMNREEIIAHIALAAQDDAIVSTTGKASRELFEIREKNGQTHVHDFLTVGSMGHSSSIALGIALQKPQTRVWCVDGDGAMLMHMGAMAMLGAKKPKNLIHIILNNSAHETVGGMPTVASSLDIPMIAKGCGYESALSVDTFPALDAALGAARQGGRLTLIEIKTALGARDDLGRPSVAARQNKEDFMAFLAQQ